MKILFEDCNSQTSLETFVFSLALTPIYLPVVYIYVSTYLLLLFMCVGC